MSTISSSTKYVPIKAVINTFLQAAKSAESFLPPNKLSNFSTNTNPVFNANGLLRIKQTNSIKQDLIYTCNFDKNGLKVNGPACNATSGVFSQAEYNGIPCNNLEGECDSSLGLTCQPNSTDSFSCQ